jgi:hypothetical protein
MKAGHHGIVDVRCIVDIACTTEALHAHVELEGIAVEPGDVVLVHAAPAPVSFGERVVCRRSATVIRAGAWRRWWIRCTAWCSFADLFEVGFSPEPLSVTAPKRMP